jgi:hypothetical protein
MQGKLLFEYAVIRVVPRVEREEFMNVGVILFCARPKYLNAVFEIEEQRLLSFCRSIDLEALHANVNSIGLICKGGHSGGPIGRLDLASRFRWLTATRSTVVQCSKVHPGFCDDPAETLSRLHQELVLL